ncbi:hypothetical protein M8C21_013725 [Ambrosia artemisiifolia]|uniref:RING-type domain-containing protein n=1 Tax=Ambrosia artemisiifolia TaxID=4212 RepID=A0AAD5GZ56_AMBAR|nr:hypothetical protein M8C21_013725 [Ambrosia artemisiifolia]
MAVEASHVTFFSPPNREMIYQGKACMYNDQLQPVYDFRTTDALPMNLSRKRSRDSSLYNQVPLSVQSVDHKGNGNEYTFLDGDISSQIYQQQLEVDRLIANHMLNVRTEIEQMRKRNTRRLITAVNEGIMKRLKTKEEEYVKIERLNVSLEEKVKSLNIENQILKESVQTNEATANALRNKLQLVLAHLQLQQHNNNNIDSTVSVDDVQSCCGSNYNMDNRQVEEEDDGYGGERKVKDIDNNDDCNRSRNRYGRINRWCRMCEREESCVLLLPCRHLCVCTLCVESISFCPVCNAIKSACVHVNLDGSS